MTEGEWLTATDSTEMLRNYPVEASYRKRTLLACGCCRRKWLELGDPTLRQRIALAERFADEVVTEEELLRAFEGRLTPTNHRVTQALRCAVDYLGARKTHSSPAGLMECLRWLAEAAGFDAAGSTLRRPRQSKHFQRSRDAELAAQAVLIRDVLGNPFRRPAFHPAWRTDTAIALARQMYDSREFSAMAILADALQDAGCDSECIFEHCRGHLAAGAPILGSPEPPPHVRGCWVVDLVLGKV